MPTGTVKWFNLRSGYGFIIPDDGSPDVFLSVRSLARSNLPRLEPGMALQYTIGGKGGRAFAENATYVGPTEVDPTLPMAAAETVSKPIDTDEFEREWGLRR